MCLGFWVWAWALETFLGLGLIRPRAVDHKVLSLSPRRWSSWPPACSTSTCGLAAERPTEGPKQRVFNSSPRP